MFEDISSQEQDAIIKLYVAFFARAPERSGADYWAQELLKRDSAMSVDQKIDQIDDRFLSDSYNFTATGFTADMPLEAFIKQMYLNALGRGEAAFSALGRKAAPTQDEIAYWVDEISSGRETRASFGLRIFRDAEIFAEGGTAPAEEIAKYKFQSVFNATRLAISKEFVKQENSGELNDNAAIIAGREALKGAPMSRLGEADLSQYVSRKIAAPEDPSLYERVPPLSASSLVAEITAAEAAAVGGSLASVEGQLPVSPPAGGAVVLAQQQGGGQQTGGGSSGGGIPDGGTPDGDASTPVTESTNAESLAVGGSLASVEGQLPVSPPAGDGRASPVSNNIMTFAPIAGTNSYQVFGFEEDGRQEFGNRESDTFRGSFWADLLVGRGGNDWLYGNGGGDVLRGGNGNDHLYGHSGHDLLFGGAGNDTLIGGAGDDHLLGGLGDDVLRGKSGDDLMKGGDGKDRLYGSAGNDTIYGNKGNDRVVGNGGHDELYGNQGNDILRGGAGTDKLYGGNGRDQLDGGTANDDLYGGGGFDILHGGRSGNDKLYGGAQGDYLSGGSGNDELYGGAGNDLLDGGRGRDEFFFSGRFGSDIILNFEQGADKLVFSGLTRDDLTIVDAAADLSANPDFKDYVPTNTDGAAAHVKDGKGNAVYVVGLRASQLEDSDFDFA